MAAEEKEAMAAPPAPGVLRLPVVSRLCSVLTLVQIASCLVVLQWYGTGTLLEAGEAAEIQHFKNAKIMLLPALLLETCYLVAAYTGDKQGVQSHAFHMSLLLIAEYLVKMLCYTWMAQMDGGIVHRNMRASGPIRGCYLTRYIGWSVAVPALLLLNSFPLIGDLSLSQFLRRLAPNAIATWAYVWSSWLAQVTPDPSAGWYLLALTISGYALSVADQAQFVRERRASVAYQVEFKVGIVVFKELAFFLYAAVYLGGIANVVSSLAEQVFYTYGDVLLKVLQASFSVIARTWEDLLKLQAAARVEVARGREELMQFIHKAKTPILSMDMEGRITGWNEHLANASRLTEEEALGKLLLDLVREEGKPALQAALADCQRGQGANPVKFTVKLPGAGGAKAQQPATQLLLNFMVQRGKDSPSIMGIGQDLTSSAALEDQEEQRKRFAKTISNELRAPLQGIMGLSGAMLEATTDKMAKKQLAMIRGCASRLVDLTANIIELSAAEVGVKPPVGEVNIMQVVDDVIGLARAAVDKAGKPILGKKVQIVNNMATGTLPLVRGDAQKVIQLVYNLLTNACKFTTEGTITLDCRHDKAKGTLEIDVADTGCGISPAAQAKIFDTFGVEDNKEIKNAQGAGLGLPVALEIARLHRGDIVVKSAVGKGSTFTITLPCDSSVQLGLTPKPVVECPKEASPPAAAAKDGPGRATQVVTPAPGLAPLLLSVDDDEINQEVVEQCMGNQYRLVRCMNGMQALQYLNSDQEFPSAILLDVMMPGLTGYQVAAEIRTKLNIPHSSLPIIMLSARSPHEESALEGLRCGATDYMQKPFSASMLKMKLTTLLGVRREFQSAPPAGRASGQAATSASPPASHAAGPSTDAAALLQEELSSVRAERDALRAKCAAAGEAEAGAAQEELKLVLAECDALKAKHAALADASREVEERLRVAEERLLAQPAVPELSVLEQAASAIQAELSEALAERDALSSRVEAMELAASQTPQAQGKLRGRGGPQPPYSSREADVQGQAGEEGDPLLEREILGAKLVALELASARDGLQYLLYDSDRVQGGGPPATASSAGACLPGPPGVGKGATPLTPALAMAGGKVEAGITSHRRGPIAHAQGATCWLNAPHVGSGSSRDANVHFLKGELELRDRQLSGMRQKLEHYESEAWLQRSRAEAFERELHHVRQQLRVMSNRGLW